MDAAHMGADLGAGAHHRGGDPRPARGAGCARSGRLRRQGPAAGRRPQGRRDGDGRPVRALPGTARMDWMAVSSYGSGTKSSGVVRILKDLDTDITGKHVLIVEDIVDSGLTLSWLVQPRVARPRLGRDLHAAAQAGGGQGRDRRPLGRLRHPQRVRRRLRAGLRRALPQPARRRHARAARLHLSRALSRLPRRCTEHPSGQSLSSSERRHRAP